MDIQQKLALFFVEATISQEDGFFVGKDNQLIIWPDKKQPGYILNEKLAAEYVIERQGAESDEYSIVIKLYGILALSQLIFAYGIYFSEFLIFSSFLTVTLLFLRLNNKSRLEQQEKDTLIQQLWERATLAGCTPLTSIEIKEQTARFSFFVGIWLLFNALIFIFSALFFMWLSYEMIKTSGIFHILPIVSLTITALSAIKLFEILKEAENSVFYANNNRYMWQNPVTSYASIDQTRSKEQSLLDQPVEKSLFAEEAPWIASQWPICALVTIVFLLTSSFIS